MSHKYFSLNFILYKILKNMMLGGDKWIVSIHIENIGVFFMMNATPFKRVKNTIPHNR